MYDRLLLSLHNSEQAGSTSASTAASTLCQREMHFTVRITCICGSAEEAAQPISMCVLSVRAKAERHSSTWGAQNDRSFEKHTKTLYLKIPNWRFSKGGRKGLTAALSLCLSVSKNCSCSNEALLFPLDNEL